MPRIRWRRLADDSQVQAVPLGVIQLGLPVLIVKRFILAFGDQAFGMMVR